MIFLTQGKNYPAYKAFGNILALNFFSYIITDINMNNIADYLKEDNKSKI